MTEICDYMKVLWFHLSQLHCRQCRQPVRKIHHRMSGRHSRILLPARRPGNPDHFDLPLSTSCRWLIPLHWSPTGYQRLLVGTDIVRIEEAAVRMGSSAPGLGFLTVVQDRLKIVGANRARFVEACEQAFHFGKGA